MEANPLKNKATTPTKMDTSGNESINAVEKLTTSQIYKKNYNKQNRDKINEYQRKRYAEKKKDKVVKLDDLSVMKETLIQQKALIELLHDKLLTQENAIYHIKRGVSVAEKNIERVGYKIAPNEAHQPEEANSETTEPFKEEEGAEFLIDAWGNVVDV
jgi:hypothetical protein